jgi:hypothetical protein
MLLMIVFHADANNFDWLEVLKVDAFSTDLTDAAGQVVELLSIRERGTSCL